MVASHVVNRPPAVLTLMAHQLRWQILTALARSDRRVSELVDLLGQPINLVSYHLKRLRQQQLVRDRRSSADSRAVYYSLDLNRLRALYIESGAALHPALGGSETKPAAQTSSKPDKPTRVLFLCTHNSARSQLAEAILRDHGGKCVEVFSAGSEPTTIHPDALAVLKAMKMDVSSLRSKHMDEFAGQSFDYIITVCDKVRENCPVFPGDPHRIHWSFQDPVPITDAEVRYRTFLVIANEIERRINPLLQLIAREQGHA